jgi:hypothetical protein
VFFVPLAKWLKIEIGEKWLFFSCLLNYCGVCQPEALIKVFKLFANDKSSILLECQAELVEAGPLNETRLRQAQADFILI